MSLAIGLDLGGTDIKGGLLDEQANILARHRIATEADGGPDHVIDRLAELTGELLKQADRGVDDLSAVGVGTPGTLDAKSGVVMAAPNMRGWTNVPLGPQLSAQLGVGVQVINDANAAAYAEYWAGVGRDPSVRHLVFLTLGTGVGGGIVLDGRVFAGAHGAGAELGHTIVEPLGRLCGCGQRGCIEQYASASAVAAEAQRRIAAGAPTTMAPKPTCEAVFAAAQAGDATAADVVEQATEYLGVVCVGFVRAFDPKLIVLGGGMAHAGPYLSDKVAAAFERRTWRMRPEQVRIVLAELGNDAGFIGAAGLAIERVSEAGVEA